MDARAETLEQLSRLCHDGEWRRGLRQAAPSGFAELDASLPGGGWPLGAVCEFMPATMGIGELSLLTPALSQLARAGRYIAWIAPPYLPYAPGLARQGLPLERILIVQTRGVQESLWAAEQSLRCPAFGAVLSWPADITDQNVRRLQLAAEAGGSLGILYRSPEIAREHSPAALRLRLHPTQAGLSVEIHKCRGGRAGVRLQLPMSHTDAALAVHPSAATCA
jgi:cell division inhibitor SulA/protein ImuA